MQVLESYTPWAGWLPAGYHRTTLQDLNELICGIESSRRWPASPLAYTLAIRQVVIRAIGSKTSKRAGRRGNTILEAALVLGPLFMLVFGTIDFAMALLMKNCMQAAVREGVRYAITGQTMNGLGQDDSIKTVVQNNALGFLSGTTWKSNVVITYYNPKTLLTVTGVNSNAEGNIVQVSVTGLSWAWMVPYGRSAVPLPISAASSDVVEPPPNGTTPAR
jgi:Flp pilus assembly protein TadG